MNMARRRAAEPELAAEAGFPVEVRMPGWVGDGELLLTDPGVETRRYEVVGGVASASTRARLDELVQLGGTALITSTPAGGEDAADGGTEG